MSIGEVAHLRGPPGYQHAGSADISRQSSRRRAGVAERLLNLSLAKSGKKQLPGDANDAIGYDEFGVPE